jgi:pyruvate dehydrogenase E2 component (dihydrolipoamide acetyltransferase)
MLEVRLPSLGAEMEEGTLLEWYVKPGDTIEYGDVIALLDTEKAEIEMEAFESGIIESLLIEPGQTVAVGTPIATLAGAKVQPTPTASGPIVQPASAEANVESRAEPETATPPEPAREEDETKPSRHRATPLARRLARERGIDLDRVSGTGHGGAITQADIPPEATATARPARAAQPSRLARRREIIAAAMVRSKREIPHYYLATAIDIQRAIEWISTNNRDRAIKDRVLLPALLIKAVANAAIEHPEINGHWRDDGFHTSEAVHVGMVISLRDGGVVVPTFRDAHAKSVAELTAELRDIVGRARAGRLRSGELGEATITVTSLGDRGAETIFGVIYPPQVAIVGFGGIHPALRSEGALHGTRSVVNATLAADHRVSDGQEGSRFLEAVGQVLADPENA